MSWILALSLLLAVSSFIAGFNVIRFLRSAQWKAEKAMRKRRAGIK